MPSILDVATGWVLLILLDTWLTAKTLEKPVFSLVGLRLVQPNMTHVTVEFRPSAQPTAGVSFLR